jgi:predicted permease
MRFLRRLWTTLFGRNENLLDQELQFHVEMRARELERTGKTPEEALREARLRFGNPAVQRERTRESTRIVTLESVVQDVRYGFRMMRRTPVFTAVAVLSLALGIGANTAIFSVLDAVLLKSLPVKDPRQIVTLSWVAPNTISMKLMRNLSTFSSDAASGTDSSTSFSYPVFERFRRASSVSQLLGFVDLENASVTVDGYAEIAQGELVSGNFYVALGISPAIGRALSDDDDREAALPVCTISYRYWQARFALDPSVVGKKIAINNAPFTVVGVEPRGFLGMTTGAAPDVVIPIRQVGAVSPGGAGARFDDEGNWWLQMAARLKPDVDPQSARAEFGVLLQQAVGPGPSIVLSRRGDGVNFARDQYRDPLLVLMAVVGVVLLIACANVANLLLARAKTREKETAMRLALGASRGRLARQLLTESLLLAAFGATLGVGIAYWAGGVLATFNGLVIDVHPDARVLGFTVGITLLTGVLFGLAPALRTAGAELQPNLQRNEPAAPFGMARGLVVAQLALSLVVLVSAGLYLRTLHNLRSVELGMDPRRLLVFRLLPDRAGYNSQRAQEFDGRVVTALEHLPGVESASISRHIPFSGSGRTFSGRGFAVPGSTIPSEPRLRVLFANVVSARFFETLHIPILMGRGIAEQDRAGAPLAAVINETFAKAYFPGASPIGRHFQAGAISKQDYGVVGVVGDSKYNAIREQAPPTFFVSYRQSPNDGGNMAFEVRSVGDPISIAASVRRAIAEIDSNVPVFEMTTEEHTIDNLIRQDRLFAALSSIFGALALLLASIGLYAVRAYAVARRTAEIGIRVALGAGRGEIAKLVLWETAGMVAAGLIVGIGSALAAARLIRSMLFGLAPNDPATFAGAAIVLVVVAAVAGYFPARRASRVDPMVALRHE